MHDVVCDVATWIANSFGDEHSSVFQAGIGLTEISHIKLLASVKRISFVSNRIERLPDNFTKCPETTSLLLQDNEPLVKIPHEFFLAFPAIRVLNLSRTHIEALPSSINSLCQLRALILQHCCMLTVTTYWYLCNLQVIDCDGTTLHCLPQGMDKLTNLRLLDMIGICLGPTYFDEISSLHNLTSLFIQLDSLSTSNRDHTWMKGFRTEVGETPYYVPFNKSARMIGVSNCESYSNGERSTMLQFASDLFLDQCKGLRKLIAFNSFDGLKALHIRDYSCHFGPVEEGSVHIDSLPNLEHLCLHSVCHLKSFSNFSQLLGLRFSKLRQLDIQFCASVTCLSVSGGFPVPKHLEEIRIRYCHQLVELLVQCGSSQATLVTQKFHEFENSGWKA